MDVNQFAPRSGRMIADDNSVHNVVDQTTGSLKMQQTGRKASLASSNYNQVLNVAANGATTVTVTPPVGELWRIRGLYLNIPAPSGATTGYHYLVGMSFGTDPLQNSKFRLQSSYNKDMQVRYNTFALADLQQIPSSEQGQIDLINSLVITNANPLSLFYQNLTDVLQNGTFTIRVDREVEYIV